MRAAGMIPAALAFYAHSKAGDIEMMRWKAHCSICLQEICPRFLLPVYLININWPDDLHQCKKVK